MRVCLLKSTYHIIAIISITVIYLILNIFNISGIFGINFLVISRVNNTRTTHPVSAPIKHTIGRSSRPIFHIDVCPSEQGTHRKRVIKADYKTYTYSKAINRVIILCVPCVPFIKEFLYIIFSHLSPLWDYLLYPILYIYFS